MGYFSMFFAGFLAGIGYEWFQRKSIWDNTEEGCFNGCLIALGTLVAAVTFTVVIALQLQYWSHAAVLFASFYGTFFLLWSCECLVERWKNRSS
ncbi:MAG TPA: hypothetical protein DEB30_03605 [Candidatus Peribacter riflensis]|uniref:Uncharacterized protein n=1 Tax=Candidatus Peribacter riflensis TaxID=1735162 RepID=A0A0S1SII7_9BACT|nr:MAG: hypothetical protein PeribacterA2_0718 [Candidatus Peribacter riflensis]OGJ77772.1 MAG: hypothetical protein A2398_00670 [Candidatus Peribacteria bacterium RIFOXYB1_FULL_57_12]OGJ80002.1 MAG: hypothetical protein A2412_00450 [Candidatus Peribacteria bacterium RIFOXYC1_FULL_58_8]ALM11187.1 MAG: hypothetical protein PeribacterB2_0719 [Candidatus Peribacter riflensis]ALM12290.1 MAG: hypothetical protein PeribacterC2_0719 [Candidatus Peribacter riflensis]